MSNLDVIRAWKDEEYRLSLSEAQLAMLPDNPAGLVELTNPLLCGEAVDETWEVHLCSVAGSCITVCPTLYQSCITACTFYQSCITFCPVEPVIN